MRGKRFEGQENHRRVRRRRTSGGRSRRRPGGNGGLEGAEGHPFPGTNTPGFVTNINEEPRRGRPEEVARGHLARHRDLYGIDVSALRARGVSRRGGTITVRFAQTHGGLEVFGGSYLVHLAKEDGGFSTTSANGEYFTELVAPTEPQISEDEAVRWARLRSRGFIVSKIERHGLKVLPFRTGALAYHLTLWGSRYGRSIKKETFVNADNGTIALAYDNLQRADGTGTNAHGEHATFTVTPSPPHRMKTPRKIETYYAAPAANGFYRPNEPDVSIVSSPSLVFSDSIKHSDSGAIDAHDRTEAVDAYFTGLNDEFEVGADLQDINRPSGRIISTVNVEDPSTGRPMINAFWDGTQMAYGNPPDSSNVLPLSAATDVVAHELTHGLDQFHVGDGLGLVYLNQSGAMNEAYSDYFGEAAELYVNGLGMDDPDAGQIGEDLCTGTPPAGVWECPLRDLDPAVENTPHTADYHYLLVDVDNGGVHENSGPFAGALWDVRKALFGLSGEAGAKRADQYIFTALADHTTPLQNFVGGRQAVKNAATAIGDDLGLTPAEIATDVAAIDQAFAAHGIESGWEKPSSASGKVLYRDVVPIGDFLAPPQVSGNRFIIGNYRNKRAIFGPLGIFVGRTDCAGCRKVPVGERGSYSNETPDIHGKRAVWTHISRNFAIDVHSRVVGRRRVTTVAGGSGIQWFPSIDGAGRRGTILAWEDIACSFCDTDIKYRYLGRRAKYVYKDRNGEQWVPQTSKNWVAWWDLGPAARRQPKIGLKNVVTGKTLIFKPPTRNAFMGPPALSDSHLYWYQDTQFYGSHPNSGTGTIVRVKLGRRTRQSLFKESSSLAPAWEGFSAEPIPSANRRFVTWSDESGLIRDPDSISPGRVGRDLFMLRLGTRTIRRVTQNRGDQGFPVVAAARSARFLWLDATRATTDVRIGG